MAYTEPAQDLRTNSTARKAQQHAKHNSTQNKLNSTQSTTARKTNSTACKANFIPKQDLQNISEQFLIVSTFCQKRV